MRIRQIIDAKDKDFVDLVTEEKSNFEEALLTHENYVDGDLPALNIGWANIIFILYKDDKAVGYCRLYIARDGSGIITPYLFIIKKFRNRGLGIVLGAYSLNFCFENLLVRKINFICFSYNPALKIYKKYFKCEGVRRKEALYKRKFYDKHLFCWFEKDFVRNKKSINRLIRNLNDA